MGTDDADRNDDFPESEDDLFSDAERGNLDDLDDQTPFYESFGSTSTRSRLTPTPEEEEFFRSLDQPRSAGGTVPAEPAPQPSGRARERQAKRRQQPMAQTKAPRPSQQIAEPNRRQLPKIRFPNLYPYRYLFAIAGAVALVVIVVAALGRLRNNPQESLPNALWLGTEWTYEQPSDEAVASLVERLRTNEIGSVYAWVSWLQVDNTWRGTANFENVQRFVSQFRAADPTARMWGWVSLPVEGTGIGYRLDDAEVRTQVAEFSRRVVEEFGFDGVFLNVEPVWNNDANFLALLRDVRAAVGPDVPISVAVPPDWSPLGEDIPVPPLIEPGTVWDREFKQNVALLVDEIALMAYNSGLGAPSDYEQWVAYQLQVWIAALSDLGEGTDLIVGIPTYDAEPPGHDPYVENVLTAVAGVRRGLVTAGDAAAFLRGLAIYADWTTTEDEWASFTDAWVRGT
jgi:hypothetical protein